MQTNKYLLLITILETMLVLLVCWTTFESNILSNIPNEKTDENETIIEEPSYEEVQDTEPLEEVETIMYFDEDDVTALSKLLYNECRGVPSTVEKACVAWIVCNRVDANGYGDTIIEVITAPSQFAYNNNTPVTDELYELALDVLVRWSYEKNGIEDVGRVLPSDYLYFHGDGERNYFRNAFSGNFDVWDYSLDNPYED